MQATTTFDSRLWGLLLTLRSVRHPHLRPLLSVSGREPMVSLRYGEPGRCPPGCDGIEGALRAIHRAGLWVGDVLAAAGFDGLGRVVLNGVGSDWDPGDPFAGHPSVTPGESDLRIAWRQRGDVLQMAGFASGLTRCEAAGRHL